MEVSQQANRAEKPLPKRIGRALLWFFAMMLVLTFVSRAASDARPWEWAVLLSGVVQPGLGLVSTGEGGGIATVPGGATRVWSPRDPVASRPSVVPAAG